MTPELVEEIVAALDRGDRRVAEKVGEDWVVDIEAKEAILEYFRLRKVEPIEVGPFMFQDKIPLKRSAPGVRRTGWTIAIRLGKIPSSAHANMSRETPRSIAGRSLVSAIAAPATISTVHPGERSSPRSPGAVRSRVADSLAMYHHGTTL